MFSMKHANLYFDAAASTPLHPEVWAEMEKFREIFGNNNSKHFQGFEAQKVITTSLQKIADILSVAPEQLHITYSGTDSNRRFLWACERKFSRENIWASFVEHSSIKDEILETNFFSPRELLEILAKKQPQVVCLMKANSETGEIFNSRKIRAKFPDAIILEDWAQAFGKGLKFETDGVDAISFAPQKIYGPKMIGLLYLKTPRNFPEISGDRHTKNPWLVAGMAKAFEIAAREESETVEKLSRWQKQIEEYIIQNIPHHKIHSENFARIPGTISVAFHGIRGAELMAVLSKEERICVSTGSACSSDIMVPTDTIKFMENDPSWQFPIRISLHKFLQDEDIEYFCEALENYVGELRR
jgi:cysteine desulfurase